jgi:hydrogenase nickel incorporation protein HypB
MEVKVLKNILGANEQLAEKNRALLDENKVFAVNIMASPGAGKTSLILETIKRLKGKTRVGVIEGDVSSSVDAEAVSKEGVPVIQINTGGSCHLDANMVANALASLPLADIDLLFVENVGNLICPAGFALGEQRKVIISSIPEGDDKPLKYPVMFHEADVVVLNKTDLLPYVRFSLDAFSRALKGINEKLEIIAVSCTSGQGLDDWVSWLEKQMTAR